MNTIFAHEPLFPHVGHEPILCFSHFFTIIKRFAALPSFCLKKHNTINTGHGPPKPTCLKRGFYGFSRPPVFQISKKKRYFSMGIGRVPGFRKFGGPLWDFFTSSLDTIEPAPLVNSVPGWATSESRQKFSSSYTAAWIFFCQKTLRILKVGDPPFLEGL